MNFNNNPISQIIKDLSDQDEDCRKKNIKQQRLKGELSKLKSKQAKILLKIKKNAEI